LSSIPLLYQNGRCRKLLSSHLYRWGVPAKLKEKLQDCITRRKRCKKVISTLEIKELIP